MNMYLPAGTLLQGGKYRIVRFIGSGGFGCTYEAEHVMLEKRVAIKEFFVKDFCNRDENTSEVVVATQSKRALVEKIHRKFIDEAKSLCRLQHPGIVRVSDVFEENGTAYYVMDYIEGHSLQDIVKAEGRLAEERSLKYIREVSEALSYVHSHNRLHLDIKPGNIMINGNDHAILIDFGASKQYDEASGENTSTLMGRTPGYAPPEQMSNSVTHFLPATDIYALGATLYKLLTGETPIDSTLLASGGEELEPLPSTVHDSTRRAVSAAMELNKGRRPQSIEAFLSMFDGDTTADKRNMSSSAEGSEEEKTEFEPSVRSGSVREEDEWKDPEIEGTIISVEDSSSVDLGLSVKWATCNLGANHPSDCGNYYAWGETSIKSEYTEDNSCTYGRDMYDIAGDARYDAVRFEKGENWRLPTRMEMEELVEKCLWKWTSQGGRNGYRVTGPSGASIFLPAAGWYLGMSLSMVGYDGYYWTSDPMIDNTQNSYYLVFDSDGYNVDWNSRGSGFPIRPVKDR